MKQKNYLRGKRAKTNGDIFEVIIKGQCHRQGIKAIKHHVPKTVVRGKLVYLEKGCPDFTILYQGLSVYFDAKSIDEGYFSYSKLNKVQHQLTDLAEIKSHGHNAGYLVWFKEPNVVGFIPIGDLLNLKPMSSIRPEQTIILGQAVPGIEPEINFARLFSLDWESKRCGHCKKII